MSASSQQQESQQQGPQKEPAMPQADAPAPTAAQPPAEQSNAEQAKDEQPSDAQPVAEQPQAQASSPGPAAAPPLTSAVSPRRSRDFGGPAYSRHIRLAALLRSSSEQPDLLRELFGVDMIADALGLPTLAVDRMMTARGSVRRRFARRVREQLGLTREHLACAHALPDDPEHLALAARYFAVAIRLAGTRRVMSRASFHALNERWGADAVAFGFTGQTRLGRHAEVLAEYQLEEVTSPTDLRLFVRSLAAHGHPGAPLVALRLGLPVALATAPVANIDLALETGLPDVAAAALAQVQESAALGASDALASNDDEAEWLADASHEAEVSAAANLRKNPDSTEAA